MKNVNKRKLLLVLGNVAVLCFLAYFASTTPKQQRTISSVEESEDSNSSILDEVNLSWDENENGLIFKVGPNEDSLCSKYNSLDIVFRAEGIAYSGEVDRIVQTSPCEENHFQQTWVPNLTQVQGDNFQKTGVFAEEPPRWVMEQIIFDGPNGTKVLSFEQIRQQYGKVPTLTPK